MLKYMTKAIAKRVGEAGKKIAERCKTVGYKQDGGVKNEE
jgi:hypothetical protein